MMRKSPNRIPVTVSGWAYLYLAVLLLLVPIRLLLAVLISAAVHEISHLIAIRMLGLQVYSVHVGIQGAKIHAQPMHEKQELLCAAAGPLGGLLLVPLFRWIPAVSLCAAVHTLYNLLPVYPADGGRLMRCGAKLLLPGKLSDAVCTVIEVFSLSAIVALCVYGAVFLHLGIIPIVLAASLLLSSAKNK